MAALAAGIGLAWALRLLVDGSCPSASAIESQLAKLLPDQQALLDVRASVGPLDELLRVEVRGLAGRLLSVHDLRANAPCAALAAAAAVIIATAVADLPRSGPPLLPLPPPPLRAPVPDAPPRPRLAVEAGAAGVLALTREQRTGGALLDLQLAPAHGSFGGRLLLLGTGTRSIALADGFADWTRVQAALLARYRSAAEAAPITLDLAAGLWGAGVLAAGRGFAQNFRSQDFDVGLGGGLRIGRPCVVGSGRIVPWIEVLGVGWLRSQTLRLASPSGASATVPAWDILVAVGVSFQRLVR